MQLFESVNRRLSTLSIRHRIALGYLVTITMLVATAAILLTRFEAQLVDNVGLQQRQRASSLLAELDHTTYFRSEMLRDFANTNVILRQALNRSHDEMRSLGSKAKIRAYILEQDRTWRAAAADQATALMDAISGNTASELLRYKQDFYRKKYGYSLFPEIFVTNRYGVNVAHTNPTSDFQQSDEEWWIFGRDRPLWIGDFAYDRSAGTHSQEIAVRIQDEQGTFLGVLKAVMDVVEYRRIIEQFVADSEFNTLHVRLLDPAGNVLYRGTREKTALGSETDVGDVISIDDGAEGVQVVETPAGDVVRAHAKSMGYGDFSGLGWTVVVDVDADEVFAPLAALWGGVVVAGLGAVALAAFWALLVTRTIVRPLEGAVGAAEQLARGRVDVAIPPHTGDELARLLESMKKLQAYTASVAQAAEKIAVGDLSVETKEVSEHDVLNRAFTNMVAYQRSVADIAQRIAIGQVDVTVEPASDRDVLNKSFATTVDYIKRVATVADRIAEGDVTVHVVPLSDRDVLNQAFARTVIYLSDMSKIADRIAEGDLTRTVTPVGEQDVMGRSLHRMTMNLTTIVHDLAVASKHVFSTTEVLSTTSTRIADGARLQVDAGQEARSMVTQAVDTLGDVVEHVKSLHHQATETRSSMEELDAGTRSIARGVDDLTRAGRETQQAITKVQAEIEAVGLTAHELEESSSDAVAAAVSGREAVKRTASSIESLSQTLWDVVEVSHALRKSTGKIGRVLEVLDDVIEQSNLLALNASIAAAQAGVHGKAFAVVAKEIRRLSQGTRQSSQEIRDLVARLQDAGQRVVRATENGRLRAEEGLGLAQRATEALQHIEESVGNTHRSLAQVQESLRLQTQHAQTSTEVVSSMARTIESIHDATVGQTRESRQIVQALHNMDHMAQHTTTSVEDQRSRAQSVLGAMEQIERFSDQSLQMADEIVKAIGVLRQQAEQLRSAAGQFRLPESD